MATGCDMWPVLGANLAGHGYAFSSQGFITTTVGSAIAPMNVNNTDIKIYEHGEKPHKQRFIEELRSEIKAWHGELK